MNQEKGIYLVLHPDKSLEKERNKEEMYFNLNPVAQVSPEFYREFRNYFWKSIGVGIAGLGVSLAGLAGLAYTLNHLFN